MALLIAGGGARARRLREILSGAGLAVTPVSGRALVASPPEGRPDLLVMDDAGPAGERLALQQRLHAMPAFRDVPLLVVAEDCGIDAFGGAIARGASGFLRASAAPEEIAEAARRLARFRPSPRRAGEPGRAVRRPLLLPVDLDRGRAGWIRGRIVDVSATGCRIEVPAALTAGATIGIVPRSCDDSTEIRLAGVVRWSRPAREGHVAALRWTATAALLARRMLGAA